MSSFDPTPDVEAVAAATGRLLATARALSDEGARAPSLLPGWSRGHVLTHLARNGDGMANALRGVADGEERTAYASREARGADIEAGADRPIDELVTDVESAHARFTDAVAAVPADRWDTAVRILPSADPVPAHTLIGGRLREVALHHLDLAAGFAAADWPPEFARHLLALLVPVMEARGMTATTLRAVDPGIDADDVVTIGGSGEPVVVSGPAHALAAWLAGRDDGASLASDGPLPTPPPFA